MEFQGRINRVFPVTKGVTRDGKEWKRQDFIFEYFEHETDRWADKVLLSVMNDRIASYDLHEGDEVTIGFGHNVREYGDKQFNEIRIYKFEKAIRPEVRTQWPAADRQRMPMTNVKEEENDPLPF